MKILWLATCDSFYEIVQSQTNEYHKNEGGWYIGLQQAILKYSKETQIELGIAFTCNKQLPFKTTIENCTYYPLIRPVQSKRKKLFHYLFNQATPTNIWDKKIDKIINDFQPDLIHFFGIESLMANYLKKTSIPSVINLLGILNPCKNAFFPIGMNEYSVKKFNRTFREILLNNQYRYAYKSMQIRAIHEKELFHCCKNIAGRTLWDKMIAEIYAPQAHYYTINEILRPIFYSSPKWKYKEKDTIEIVSTISENIYKGYDLILKAAALMTEMKINFKWKVIGISHKSKFAHFFEKHYNISSSPCNITLMGRMDAENIQKLLLESDLYIHPSYIDNSPNSVCEAQYIGIPTIACYVGGVPSLIEHEKNGWLIPTNAPYEIAFLVKKYRELPLKQISENEIKTAEERHNPHKIYQEVIKCYNEILNKGYDK